MSECWHEYAASSDTPTICTKCGHQYQRATKPPVNIDELERLHAKASEGPWETSHCYGCTNQHQTSIESEGGMVAYAAPYANIRTAIANNECASQNDAALIVAMRNALPALLAELRELRVYKAQFVEHAKEYSERVGELHSLITLRHEDAGTIATLEAELAASRAECARLKMLDENVAELVAARRRVSMGLLRDSIDVYEFAPGTAGYCNACGMGRTQFVRVESDGEGVWLICLECVSRIAKAAERAKR